MKGEKFIGGIIENIVNGTAGAERWLRSHDTANKLWSYLDYPFEKMAGKQPGYVSNMIKNGEKYNSAKHLARVGLQTYAVGNTAYRIASGGGLYRDKEGNFDIMGVPFI
jgi:hypothetical protein